MANDGKVVIGIEADDSGFEETISDVEKEAKEAAGGLDDLGDAAEGAGDGLGVAEVAAGAFIANALTGLISFIGDTVKSFFELSEATREYRDDMAKLETAFGDAGHTTATAQKAYDDFYAILGESDRTVEAVNHLAELTNNEKELAQWSTIAAGVTAKFGDSLPIEGLTEAANHTAKLGEVQGPLADALEWAGLSSENFNKQLAECSNEQERASLITNTLNGVYAEAGAEYNALTASTQEARRATNEMEQAQAAVGEALEPVTTAWTNLKAQGMQWIAETGIPAVQTGFAVLSANLPAVATGISGLTAAFVAFKVAQIAATAATQGMTIVQYAAAAAQAVLNATMLANPISLIILAITALVTAFIALWNNCDGFREFWINLWENIKSIVSAGVEKVKEIFNKIISFVKENWQGLLLLIANPFAGAFKLLWDNCEGFRNFWIGLWEDIKRIVSAGIEKVKEIFNAIIGFIKENWQGLLLLIVNPFAGAFKLLWDNCEGFRNFWIELWESIKTFVSDAITAIADWFMQLPERIAYAIGVVIGHVVNFAVSLWEFATVDIPAAISAVIEWFAQLPGRIWEWLQNTAQKIAEWAVNIYNKAVETGSNFINAIVSFFKQLPGKVWGWLTDTAKKIADWAVNVYNKAVEIGTNFVNAIINFFKQLPGKVWEWLKNTVAKIVNFATEAKNKATSAATGIFNAIVNGIKELPGKVLDIGKNIISGLWEGISSGWNWLKDKVTGLADNLVQGVEDTLDINSPSKRFAYSGRMSVAGIGSGWDEEIGDLEKEMQRDVSGLTARVQATVGAENAKAGAGLTSRDAGMYDLVRAVGTQTAGINSLAGEYRRGAGSTRPVVLQLNGRELGRAVVDVGGQENVRVGTTLAFGNA